jgi:transcriptional regulator with XRE-family HTH domain
VTIAVWLAIVPSVPRHRQSLGKRIRLYRKLNRFTQEKLAEKAELAPSYVSDVERGRVNISVDAVQRIAKALKIRLRDLFE